MKAKHLTYNRPYKKEVSPRFWRSWLIRLLMKEKISRNRQKSPEAFEITYVRVSHLPVGSTGGPVHSSLGKLEVKRQ